MDHMRNCIKGAKNSIPLRYLLLGTEWKTELKIAEIKAVIRGRAYRSILGRQWRTMNRQGERWVRNVRILPVSPFLCFCGRPVLCTQSMKQSWGTPNWLLLFFNILSFMSCLYILEINPLSVTLFANIFYHSMDCLFVLFMVYFSV